MGVLVLVGLLLLNGAVSWVNACVAGQNWHESKAVGGWPRFMVWCGAIQSAIGFSSIILCALLALASVTHFLPPTLIHKAFSLWYLLIIFPALGTGFAILIESWRAAYRDRDLMSIGTAAYNTMAMWHNASGAMDGIGGAFKDVISLFSSDTDGESPAMAVMVIALVLLALGAGILLTAGIIQRYAGTVPLPVEKKQALTA